MKRAMLLSVCLCAVAQADYLGTFKINDYLFESVTLHRFSSGAAYDATGDVHMDVYEIGNAAQIIDDNDLTKFDTVTGFYGTLTQLKASTGFEAGKMYTCLISATVDGVAAIHKDTFQILAPVDVETVLTATPAGTPELRAAVTNVLKAAITPADANNNSVWDLVYLLGHLLAAQPATTINTVTDAGQFTITAGSAVNNFYTCVVVEDASDSNRRAIRFVTSYTGATKTIKCDENLPFLPVAGDPVYLQTNRAVGRGRQSP